MEQDAKTEPVVRTGRIFPWQGLVLEFLSVLLGVLAAFGVSEWGESRAQRRLADLALANINREIAANREHLLEVRAANLEAAGKTDEEGGEVETYALGWGLQSTAWEVARSTGAVHHLDYGTVLSLSSLYQFQQTYTDLIHGLAQAQMVAILSAEGDDLEQIERGLGRKTQLYLDLMVDNEKQLLEWYERALRHAGRAPAGAGPADAPQGARP